MNLFISNSRKFIISLLASMLIFNFLIYYLTKDNRIPEFGTQRVMTSKIVSSYKWELINDKKDIVFLGDSSCFSMYIPDINELNLCTDGSSTPQDDILRISNYFEKEKFQAEKVIFLQTFTGWISEKNDLRFDSPIKYNQLSESLIANTPIGVSSLKSQMTVFDIKEVLKINIPIYSEKSTLKEKLQNNTIDSISKFDGKNLSYNSSISNGHLEYIANEAVTLVEIENHLNTYFPISYISKGFEDASVCNVSDYEKKIVTYLIQLSKEYNFDLIVGISPVRAELSSTKPYSECVEYLYNDLVNSFSNIKVVDSHNFVFSAKESVLTNHTNLEAAKRFTKYFKDKFLK